jgi:tetratricopeptide (TPR) repeat protein
VAVGVKYAKLGKYKEAMRKYNEALNVDPTNVDALVARGAAFVFLISQSIFFQRLSRQLFVRFSLCVFVCLFVCLFVCVQLCQCKYVERSH